ncbi:MAG: hypothetical protein EBS53_05890, partial [Bacteroidetes bacterium]|nr:hypothetical protein [Bacteroidota bacterium]
MSKKSGDRNRRLRAYSDGVTRLMREEQGKQTLNPKQISVRLGIADSMDRILLEEAIEKLCVQKILEQVEPGQYRLRTKSVDPVAVAGVEGWLQFTNGGSVFLRRADGGEDLRVNEDRLQGVLPDDKVVVRLPRKTPQRGRPKVDVVALIERTRRFYVGILQRQGTTWRVAVDLPGYLLHFKLNNAPNSTCSDNTSCVVKDEAVSKPQRPRSRAG